MKESILELRELGFSYNEISNKLNCSKSTISYHCSKIEDNDEKIKNNLLIKNLKQVKDDSFLLEGDINLVISLRKDKKSYKDIKKLTNLSINKISKICRKYNIVKNRVYSYSKIDSDTIKKIQSLYDELGSIREVSDEMKISRSTVSKYIQKLEKDKLPRNVQLSRNVVEWRKRKKIELLEYKGGKCEKCGYNKCVDALEFHHIDPNEKDFTISGKSWSFDRLKNEVDKCILLCSNCHREIHYELKLTRS
jgi:DNA invertase Pin-like site-specific DNA recombinase